MMKGTPLVTKEWIIAEFSKLEREIQELKKEQEEIWKS